MKTPYRKPLTPEEIEKDNKLFRKQMKCEVFKRIKKSIEGGTLKQDKRELWDFAQKFYTRSEFNQCIGLMRDSLNRIERDKIAYELKKAVRFSVSRGTFEQDIPNLVKLSKNLGVTNPDHKIEKILKSFRDEYEDEKRRELERRKVNYSNQTPVKWVMDSLSPESGVVFVSAKECSNETIMGTEIDEFVTEQNKENSSIPKDKTFLLITDRLHFDIALTPLIERIQARDSILFIDDFDYPVKNDSYYEPFVKYNMELRKIIVKYKAKEILINGLSKSKDKRKSDPWGSIALLKSLQEVARDSKVVIKILVKELSDESMLNILYLKAKNGSQLQRELRGAGHARSEGIVKFHTKNLYGERKGMLLQKHVNINARGYEVCRFEKVRNLTLNEIENIDNLCKRTTRNEKTSIMELLKELLRQKGGRASKEDIYSLKVNKESIRKALYRGEKAGHFSKQGNEYVYH